MWGYSVTIASLGPRGPGVEERVAPLLFQSTPGPTCLQGVGAQASVQGCRKRRKRFRRGPGSIPAAAVPAIHERCPAAVKVPTALLVEIAIEACLLDAHACLAVAIELAIIRFGAPLRQSGHSESQSQNEQRRAQPNLCSSHAFSPFQRQSLAMRLQPTGCDASLEARQTGRSFGHHTPKAVDGSNE